MWFRKRIYVQAPLSDPASVDPGPLNLKPVTDPAQECVVVYRADDGWRYRLQNGSVIQEGDRGRKQLVYTVRQARRDFPGVAVYQESNTGLELVV